MGIGMSETGAGTIVGIQMRPISFAARCVMRGCGACAIMSIRPIDHIGWPATADLLVCAAHADALEARARGKGMDVSIL